MADFLATDGLQLSEDIDDEPWIREGQPSLHQSKLLSPLEMKKPACSPVVLFPIHCINHWSLSSSTSRPVSSPVEQHYYGYEDPKPRVRSWLANDLGLLSNRIDFYLHCRSPTTVTAGLDCGKRNDRG